MGKITFQNHAKYKVLTDEQITVIHKNALDNYIPVSGMRSDLKRLRASDSYLTPAESKKQRDKNKGKHRYTTQIGRASCRERV